MTEYDTTGAQAGHPNDSRLLQALPAAAFAVDVDGRLLFWNDAAERLFGFEASRVIGQSLDVIIPEHLRAPHWCGYQRAMATGKTKHAGRPTLTKALHRSGETHYVEMSFAVVADSAESVVGSVAIARAANFPDR